MPTATCFAHGAHQDVVRFELVQPGGRGTDIAAASDADADELVLARSGHMLRLEPEVSIVEVVLALGVEVENNCRDGIRGRA